MIMRTLGAVLLISAATAVSYGSAVAATQRQSGPSIAITSPSTGATVHGPVVTVHVTVSNFKLVPPVYINPPKLTGNQGHIHYVLDDLANFVATRDANTRLSHSWSGVLPGHHTVIVYLATSQHARFPGAKEARVSFTVTAQSAGGGSSKPQSSSGPQIHSMPRTGGASPEPFGTGIDLLEMLLSGLALLLGFGIRVFTSGRGV